MLFLPYYSSFLANAIRMSSRLLTATRFALEGGVCGLNACGVQPTDSTFQSAQQAQKNMHIGLMRFRYADHARAIKLIWGKVIIPIDALNNEACALKEEFHFVALEKIEIGGDDGTPHCAALAMLIVEVCEFQQMLIRRGGRADEMAQQRPVVAPPCALMQHMTAKRLHIARVGVADIDDEGAAGTQVGTNGTERLLLPCTRGDVRERTEGDKGQAELLLQVHCAHILLYQYTAPGQPGIFQAPARQV